MEPEAAQEPGQVQAEQVQAEEVQAEEVQPEQAQPVAGPDAAGAIAAQEAIPHMLNIPGLNMQDGFEGDKLIA